jgi:excisionase family DNA binding protein
MEVVTEYLTVGDAALIIGFSADSVRKAVSDGHLRIAATTPGGMRLFHSEDVQRFKRTREARKRAAR